MKILVLSPIYPRIDAKKNTTATKVIHYFALEWRKQGHEVRVVHTPNRILKIFYVMPQKIKDFLKAKTGNEFPDVSITKKNEYVFDDIPVYRRPVFKLIPRSMPSENEVKRTAKDINRVLESNSFQPDVIVSHWSAPCFQLISALSSYYSCRKSIVLHDDHYTEKYRDTIIPCLQTIDAIGCRSKTLAEKVKKQLGLSKLPFICYSGVPDEYVNTSKFQPFKFREPLTRFIYVGELIERKYCDVVISALSRSDIKNWHLDVVGIGNDRERFEDLSTSLHVSDKVTFHGRIPREEVFELMQKAQCFVMPSKNEAFGLVYLEAMVSSCIAIGSFKEGIDGIIEDGKNGFLVKPGNEKELLEVLNRMNAINPEELCLVANNGYNTAIKFTDSLVAQKYIGDAVRW